MAGWKSKPASIQARASHSKTLAPLLWYRYFGKRNIWEPTAYSTRGEGRVKIQTTVNPRSGNYCPVWRRGKRRLGQEVGAGGQKSPGAKKEARGEKWAARQNKLERDSNCKKFVKQTSNLIRRQVSKCNKLPPGLFWLAFKACLLFQQWCEWPLHFKHNMLLSFELM